MSPSEGASSHNLLHRTSILHTMICSNQSSHFCTQHAPLHLLRKPPAHTEKTPHIPLKCTLTPALPHRTSLQCSNNLPTNSLASKLLKTYTHILQHNASKLIIHIFKHTDKRSIKQNDIFAHTSYSTNTHHTFITTYTQNTSKRSLSLSKIVSKNTIDYIPSHLHPSKLLQNPTKTTITRSPQPPHYQQTPTPSAPIIKLNCTLMLIKATTALQNPQPISPTLCAPHQTLTHLVTHIHVPHPCSTQHPPQTKPTTPKFLNLTNDKSHHSSSSSGLSF